MKLADLPVRKVALGLTIAASSDDEERLRNRLASKRAWDAKNRKKIAARKRELRAQRRAGK